MTTRFSPLAAFCTITLGMTLVLSTLSCADFGPDPLEADFEAAAIKGGNAVLGNNFPSVARLTITRPAEDDVDCSGSLIAANLILTSAECLVDVFDEGGAMIGTITVGFGANGGDPVGGIVGQAVEFHRYYKEDNPAAFQLAIITLAQDAPATLTPVVLNDMPIDNFNGMVTLVGYGETNNDIGLGARRGVEVPIRSITKDLFSAGTADATTCRGDSGGPIFADLGSGPVQIGVTNATNRCSDRTQRTRVDRHVKDFIFRYIDRFYGPCIAGDICVTDGCRSPDPDCNVCEWGNTCATAADQCLTSDWDCPVGGFVGDGCQDNVTCEENGRCIEALDDATFLYCSKPCVMSDPRSCPSTMTCRSDGSGGNECVFQTPSPGSQGFTCRVGGECRSGICEDKICVNTCTPGAGECPSEFTCGPSKEQVGTHVCLGEDLSGGGGFCSTTSSGGGTASLLVLCALVGIGRRKSRRTSTRDY